MGPLIALVLTAVSTVIISLEIWRAFYSVIWRPYTLTKYFEKQGIRGPSYTFWHGSLPEMMQLRKTGAHVAIEPNSHHIVPKIMPHYHKWRSDYGPTFLYWFATQPTIFISDAEMAKDVLTNHTVFNKIKPRPVTKMILGNGLPLLNGSQWMRHRTLLNPAFNMDKIKGMVKIMADHALSLLDDWKHQIVESSNQNYCKEIEVAHAFECLVVDTIASCLFGTSNNEGKEIMAAAKVLHKMFTANVMANFIPGNQYFPTPANRKSWKLSRIMSEKMLSIMKVRSSDSNTSQGFGNDLLGLLMEAASENGNGAKGSIKLSSEEIIAECQATFFAGQETTTNLLTWATYLLSINQEWQDRIREEVLSVCGTEVPDAAKLNKLKLMTMVLYEALRLYGPAIIFMRDGIEDAKVGNLMVPKNTAVCIATAMIHHDKKYWGEDANQFNPRRFENGVAKAANHPNAMLAFSLGPRACIGQNYAMLQVKTVFSLLLQRFSFTISPNYKHAPKEFIILSPEFGLPILLRPLSSPDINSA
ncbi:hypothetical protein Sjap_007113 [Stephania japonica]|uniref:Cytochrome P450 n=1 Tax=Stephania japonica TaxID=461633 RepID=A0AAP0JMI8_9MAGN